MESLSTSSIYPIFPNTFTDTKTYTHMDMPTVNQWLWSNYDNAEPKKILNEQKVLSTKLEAGAIVYSKSTGKGHFVLIVPIQLNINVNQLQISNKIEIGAKKSQQENFKQYQVDGWVALDKKGNPVELLTSDLTTIKPETSKFPQSFYTWIAFWPMFLSILFASIYKYMINF